MSYCVDVADRPSAMEDFKATVGYGMPTPFPIAISGIGLGEIGWDVSASEARPPMWFAGLRGLGCGGGCPCKKCSGMSDWVPTEAEAKAGTSQAPLGQQYFKAQAAAPAAQSSDQTVNRFNSIWGTITGTLAPIFQTRAAKAAGRPKVTVQREAPEQDWITPAIIAGGVIVAGVLAAAIAKKR